MKYSPTIGLEIHVELSTQSKMFCNCSAKYFGELPNTHVCPVCLGLPGAMPVPNQQAIQSLIMLGLALEGTIPPASKFDRKNYFYPDLPKGYQISQFDLPFTSDLKLKISDRYIKIERAHMEEDTAKLTHTDGRTLIDFNRSGVPLIEIVSTPDLFSADEAVAYAQEIQRVVRYLGISDADMEKGQMRFDANISVSAKKRSLGTKVEIKNLNSFRSLKSAIEFEIDRQIVALNKGEKVLQETRGYSQAKNQTVAQRSKESAHDYRYFPEPDIPIIEIKKTQVAQIKEQIPLLPDEERSDLTEKYGLEASLASDFVDRPEILSFFKQAVSDYETTFDQDSVVRGHAVKIANWLASTVLFTLKEKNLNINDLKITPASIAELVYLVDQKRISSTQAKEVYEIMLTDGRMPQAIVEKDGFSVLSDQSELEPVIEAIIQANPKVVEDYRAGKTTVLQYLIGLVMAQTKGKADPSLTRQLLEQKLN